MDESEEINYIKQKKNINEDIGQLLEEGYSIEESQKLSKMRVFGCSSGNLWCRSWSIDLFKTMEYRRRFRKTYINWSSYAYNSDYHGKS